MRNANFMALMREIVLEGKTHELSMIGERKYIKGNLDIK